MVLPVEAGRLGLIRNWLIACGFRIRLRHWNGQLPNGRGTEAVGGEEDWCIFQTGIISKAKLAASREEVDRKLPFAEVPVPLEKVATVVFAAPKIQPDEEKSAWITLWGRASYWGNIRMERKRRARSDFYIRRNDAGSSGD